MRLVWVPQWTVLPVIVEDRVMGDENIEPSRLAINAPAKDTLNAEMTGKLSSLPVSCKSLLSSYKRVSLDTPS